MLISREPAASWYASACCSQARTYNSYASLHQRPSVLTTSGDAPAAKSAVAPPILRKEGEAGVEAKQPFGAAAVDVMLPPQSVRLAR